MNKELIVFNYEGKEYTVYQDYYGIKCSIKENRLIRNILFKNEKKILKKVLKELLPTNDFKYINKINYNNETVNIYKNSQNVYNFEPLNIDILKIFNPMLNNQNEYVSSLLNDKLKNNEFYKRLVKVGNKVVVVALSVGICLSLTTNINALEYKEDNNEIISITEINKELSDSLELDKIEDLEIEEIEQLELTDEDETKEINNKQAEIDNNGAGKLQPDGTFIPYEEAIKEKENNEELARAIKIAIESGNFASKEEFLAKLEELGIDDLESPKAFVVAQGNYKTIDNEDLKFQKKIEDLAISSGNFSSIEEFNNLLEEMEIPKASVRAYALAEGNYKKDDTREKLANALDKNPYLSIEEKALFDDIIRIIQDNSNYIHLDNYLKKLEYLKINYISEPKAGIAGEYYFLAEDNYINIYNCNSLDECKVGYLRSTLTHELLHVLEDDNKLQNRFLTESINVMYNNEYMKMDNQVYYDGGYFKTANYMNALAEIIGREPIQDYKFNAENSNAVKGALCAIVSDPDYADQLLNNLELLQKMELGHETTAKLSIQEMHQYVQSLIGMYYEAKFNRDIKSDILIQEYFQNCISNAQLYALSGLDIKEQVIEGYNTTQRKAYIDTKKLNNDNNYKIIVRFHNKGDNTLQSKEIIINEENRYLDLNYVNELNDYFNNSMSSEEIGKAR